MKKLSISFSIVLLIIGIAGEALAEPQRSREQAWQRVEVELKDGLVMVTNLYLTKRNPSAAGLLMLLPEAGRDRWSRDEMATTLARIGVNVVVPDLRGIGESTIIKGEKTASTKGKVKATSAEALHDVEAQERAASDLVELAEHDAIGELLAVKKPPVGLLAEGLAGSIAVRAALERPMPLVLVEPEAAKMEVESLSVPVLLYVGEETATHNALTNGLAALETTKLLTRESPERGQSFVFRFPQYGDVTYPFLRKHLTTATLKQ